MTSIFLVQEKDMSFENMRKERIQTEVIPFMRNVQNREIYKDKGLLRPGEWRMIAEGYGVSF